MLTATSFFLSKALIALVASVLLTVHIWLTWDQDMSIGRRLRYLALLGASLGIANASRVQAQDDLPVDQRAVQGLVVAVLILAAAVVSLIEEARWKRSLGSSTKWGRS